MSKSTKKSQKKTIIILLVPLFLLILALGLLYKEKYLNCLTSQFSMCISSKAYTSASNKFMFRYPNDYPVTFKTGSQMVSEYNFDDKYIEWVNFSNEFYPNAGGDRLGSVIVEKNSPYKSVEDYGNKITDDFNKLPEKLKGTPPHIEYVMVGGEKAVRVTTAQQPSSFTPPSDDYVVIHDGAVYNISFDYNDYYHKLPVQHYQQGKELILSTFTFN